MQVAIDQDHGAVARAERRRLSWSILGLVALSVAIVAIIGVFGYVAYHSLGTRTVAPSVSSAIAAKDPSLLGGIVDSVFGTIQFSIAVLSGVIIIFTGIISFVVGRSARQAQEASRQELGEVAELYRQNLSNVSQTLIANARDSVNQYMNIASVEATLENYRKLLDELNASYESVKPVVDDFLSFRQASQELSADYSGGFLRLSQEQDEHTVEHRGSLWATPEERAILQQSLVRVQEGALRRAVSANTCFNAAQMAATFEFEELAHRLAVLANWLDAKPLYESRVHRSEFERGDRYQVRMGDAGAFLIESDNPQNDPDMSETIRQEAFASMVATLPDVPIDSCHNYYSEVWNVFIHKGDLSAFIALYESTKADMVARGRYVPSYFHLQLARAYAIVSKPGWMDAASSELGVAIAKFREESPLSTWHRSTGLEIAKLVQALSGGANGSDEDDGGAPPVEIQPAPAEPD